eukprot:COSAG02_NODE_3439_length_6743_cov_9.291541_4_plen_68_part_00
MVVQYDDKALSGSDDHTAVAATMSALKATWHLVSDLCEQLLDEWNHRFLNEVVICHCSFGFDSSKPH